MNPNTLTRLLSDRLPNFQELKAIAPHNSSHLLHFTAFTAAEGGELIHYAGKLAEGRSLTFREFKREPLPEFASLPHSILKWNGLNIGVDYLPGAVRFPSRVYAKKLRSGYGRIHGLRGEDGRSPRCFLYPGLLKQQPEGSDLIFEVEQQDFDSGRQVKYLVGYPSQDEATAAYLREMPEGFLQGVRKVAIADLEQYRRQSDFEESFDFNSVATQPRDDRGRWTSGLNRAANVLWSRKTQGVSQDVDTGKEYSDQAKRRILEEYKQEVRAAYLRHGNQMSKAIIASELLTDRDSTDTEYEGSESDLLDTMMRRSLNKIDAEPLSKAIIEGSGIDLKRSRERDRPVFKDEGMDVDAALRRYFDGWKPARQDIEEISDRAARRDNWARQEIIGRLGLDRLPSRYRPFLKDALGDINADLLENLLLGGNKLLTREELEEEGYEFGEYWIDFSENNWQLEFAEVWGVWFEGRRTPILVRADSRDEAIAKARKKKQRGGDGVVKVRSLTEAERKIAARGDWVRSGPDPKRDKPGYNPRKKGYGPPPKTSSYSEGGGIPLSDLPQNEFGQYHYQGSWWELDVPLTSGNEGFNVVLALKEIQGTPYVKLIEFPSIDLHIRKYD